MLSNAITVLQRTIATMTLKQGETHPVLIWLARIISKVLTRVNSTTNTWLLVARSQIGQQPVPEKALGTSLVTSKYDPKENLPSVINLSHRHKAKSAIGTW